MKPDTTSPAPEVGTALILAEPTQNGSFSEDRLFDVYVSRVGRKYVYANQEGSTEQPERKFHVADGVEAVTVGHKARLFTHKGWEEHVRTDAAARLRVLGWTHSKMVTDRPPLAVLEGMVALLDG